MKDVLLNSFLKVKIKVCYLLSFQLSSQTLIMESMKGEHIDSKVLA